ncbi:RagB/SusD family nutrient uptake outer membrane protein [Winogradskyella sp. 3972H.M.0a.05]|uniref:RagB/SusD family nutrient uptake outer membrane protein n=1 Tax=Winogradskyella sp. 3972H.M.0a.05 TaxID=2950277 RepID=UPI003391FE2D
MKRIYNTIRLALAVSVLTVNFSCNDATEIVQVGELGVLQAFQSVDDIRSGLSAAYNRYGPDAGGNDAGVDYVYFNDIFTDNIKRGIDNAGQASLTYNFILQPGSTTPGVIWTSRYRVITQINIVLDAIERLEFTEAEMLEINHIKGQLYALRALSHFDLFTYYTTDYQDPSALSAINIDFVTEPTSVAPRNTAAETIAFIQNDLDLADSFLDPNNSDSANNIFLNNDAVKAIRARLAIMTGDVSTAMTLSTQLVNDYPLANPTQYFNMFNDADDTEVIFKLSRVAGDRQVAGLYYFNLVAPDGGAYIELGNGLLNQLDTNDIRFAVNVNAQSVINGVNDPTNLLLINKYPGSADGPLINDIKLFRASEMLLIRAEAQARSGMLTEAAQSIQDLRTARFLGAPPAMPVFGSLNDALNEILAERRVELCFEGHRYIDIKRIGSEIGVGIQRETVDCESFSAPCSLPAGDFRLTLPIPTSEFEGNTLVEQNAGY